MTFKKIMSAVMAGAMVLSLGVPAFASSTSSGITLESADPYEFTIDGTTAVPTIKIVVPENAGVIANPYNLEVDASAIGGTATEDGTIISPVQWIKNLSKVDIEVAATAAGYVGGEVTFSENALTGSETTKKAYVTFEMAEGDGTNEPGAYTHTAVLKADDEHPVAVAAADSSKLTMAASTNGTDVAATGAVAFHFDGELTPAEKVVTTGDNAQAPWNDGDTFGAAIVFNFTSKTNAAGSSAPSAGDATVTLDNSTLTVANGTPGTLTATFAAGTSGLTATSYAWSSDAASIATASGTTATGTVTWVAAGSANVTVTVTLSNGSTVTATCAVTCS